MIHKLQAQFFEDVSRHEKTRIVDNGIYRHIRFKRPDSNCYGFDIITWPMHLLITGDCGSYLFSRVEDMFDFFTIEKNDWNYAADGLPINPSYWAEKILAGDYSRGRHDPVFSFSLEKFESFIDERHKAFLDEMVGEDITLSEEDLSDLDDAIHDLKSCVGSVDEAYNAISNFDWSCGDPHPVINKKPVRHTVNFIDVYEHDFQDFSYNYIWNLLAIVWGIQKYRETV